MLSWRVARALVLGIAQPVLVIAGTGSIASGLSDWQGIPLMLLAFACALTSIYGEYLLERQENEIRSKARGY